MQAPCTAADALVPQITANAMNRVDGSSPMVLVQANVIAGTLSVSSYTAHNENVLCAEVYIPNDECIRGSENVY